MIESRIPFADYLAVDRLSISRLKEMARSPQHYRYRLAHPRETNAMTLGTAAHTAVLEPIRFAAEYAAWTRRSEKTGNLCPRNGQYWEAFESENAGRTIITEDEYELAVAMQAAVRASPAAMRYLANGDPEVSMQWEPGRKGRVDWFAEVDDEPCLVGLKTARDCRHMIFGNAAAKLRYHLQWAWYYDGFTAISGQVPRVVEIVVESAPPHAVAVYTITQDIIAQGRDEYEQLLSQLAECEATGIYPGPHEIEEELTLPSWIYEQTDDITTLDLE